MQSLSLPIRKDKFGKLSAILETTFPEDFLEVQYGSIVVSTGAFRVKLIAPKMSEEEVVKSLEELSGKKISILIRFKMFKLTQGLKEVSLPAPEGTASAPADSSITFSLNKNGFGDVSAKVESTGNATTMHLPDGDVVVDFPIGIEGKATLSYGLSRLQVKPENSESEVSYNLLKTF